MHPWPATTQTVDPIFGGVRRVPVALILATVATHLVLKGVFFSDWFLRGVADPVAIWTGGLMQPATAAGLIQLFVLVGVGIMLLGRLSPAHIGVRTAGLQKVIPIILSIWGLGYLICVILGATATHATASGLVIAGSLLEATAGSAIPEELFYRGFLLVQVFLMLRQRRSTWTLNRCLLVAVIGVSVYFAASHIPASIRAGLPADEAVLWLVHAALVGAMMSVLFIQTGNILMPVAAHALINLSLPLLVSPVPPQLVLLVLVCLVMLSGQWLFGRTLVPVPSPPR